MSNPFDPITEQRKHDFYERGYECGVTGWIFEHREVINRTSWSQGYHAAVSRKKMNQLILGEQYEYIDSRLLIPVNDGT